MQPKVGLHVLVFEHCIAIGGSKWSPYGTTVSRCGGANSTGIAFAEASAACTRPRERRELFSWAVRVDSRTACAQHARG